MDDRNSFENYYRSDAPPPWELGQPSPQLVRTLDAGKLPGRTALEFGCGTGHNAVELARRGYEVTAVDFVPEAIQAAERLAEQAGLRVRFLCGDLLKLNLGGPYDVLFDRGVYHHIRRSNWEHFAEVLRTVSQPGTHYLSLAGNAEETPPPDQGGPPRVTEEQIRSELGSIFEILELERFRFGLEGQSYRPLAWYILMRRT